MIKINKSTFLHYYTKFVKEKGTPEYIARGWALGMFVGFAVPFGLQLIIVVPLSFLVKGSRIGAVTGTFVTNHVTILFIYPLQTWFGSYIIGRPISYLNVKSTIAQFMDEPGFRALFRLGGEIVASFLAGGLFLALATAPAMYFIARLLVVRSRRRREKRRAKDKSKE